MPEPDANPLPRKISRIALLLLALAAFGFALWWIKQHGLMKQALDWIHDLGPVWGPIVFILIYTVSVLLLVPASIFTVGAGFVYGMGLGSIYVLLAANIAGNLTFLIGRHFARDWVNRKLEGHPKFKAIDEATAREGWKIVALVRLAPVFPFSVMSYAFSLTRVSFLGYALANLTMIPGTLMYVYFGSVAGDLTEKPANPPWVKWVIGAITVVVILYISRFAKRALTRRISSTATLP